MTAENVRAQIVEAMAAAIYVKHFPGRAWPPPSRGYYVADAAAALDAALSVRTEVPCPECKGKGWLPLMRGGGAPGNESIQEPRDCSRCEGRGIVPSDVPAIVGLLMEREGWLLYGRLRAEPLIEETRATGHWVYRLRSIPEGDAK